MKKRIIGTSLLAGLLMLSQPVFSTPALINYQGVLTNISGKNIVGPVTIKFEIWDSETNGISQWFETHSGVTIQDGVYNVILGSINTNTLTPDLFANDESWLEVTVNGEVLTPRQRITSVAYAHNANLLGGKDATVFALNADLQTGGSSSVHWNNLTNVPAGLNDGDTDTHGTDMWTDGTGKVTTTGNVGIGTTTPAQELDVVGDIRLQWTTSDDTGVIYKDGSRFIHNFQHPNNIPAGRNTFVGARAGNFTMGANAPSSSYSSHNTGVGASALTSNSLGFDNTAIGSGSLYSNTSGRQNTSVGAGSLYNNSLGYINTAIGASSLSHNTTGNGNVALGHQALYKNVDGGANTALGILSGQNNTIGRDNTAIGRNSLIYNSTGSKNTALGSFACGINAAYTAINNSVYIGFAAEASGNVTNENVFGYDAIGAGSNSVVLGNNSITKTLLKGNVGIGTATPTQELDLVGNLKLEQTTSSDTGVIYKGSLPFIHNFRHPNNLPAGQNTFVGVRAGNFTMGANARSSTDSSRNTGVGYNALSANSLGDVNTAVGTYSLHRNTTGRQNSALGDSSLFSSFSGDANTAIGYSALGNITTTSNNTALGGYAGKYFGNSSSNPNQTTDNSVYVGYSTSASADGVTNENVFGYDAIGAGSNSVVLGNDSITKTLLKGNIGIGTTSPTAGLHIRGAGYPDSFIKLDTYSFSQDSGIRLYENRNVKWHLFNSSASSDKLRILPEGASFSNGGITVSQAGNVGVGTSSPSHLLHVNGVARSTQSTWATSSDERVKENIEPILDGIHLLDKLRPVSFEYTQEYQDGNDALGGKRLGFIAQEVEEVIPEMVSEISETFHGQTIDDFRLLNTDALFPLLVSAVKDLKAENDALKELVCLDHPEASVCQD